MPRSDIVQVQMATNLPPAEMKDTSSEQRLQLSTVAVRHQPAEGDKNTPNQARTLCCKVCFAGCAPGLHGVLLPFCLSITCQLY